MSKKEENEGEFPTKYEKLLPTGFADDANSMDEEQLKKVIIDSENSINEVEREMKADQKLSAAKEVVSDLSKAYKDTMKCQTAKIKYALYLLEGMGKI